MRNVMIALAMVFGLMATPSLAADACKHGPSYEMLLEMAKTAKTKLIVVQGEGLAKFDAAVQKGNGPVKPVEITKLVFNADEMGDLLLGKTKNIAAIAYMADGCRFGSGVASFGFPELKQVMLDVLGVEDPAPGAGSI